MVCDGKCVHRCRWGIGVGLLCLFGSGCGSSSLDVEGQVFFDENPIVLVKNRMIQVGLRPISNGSTKQSLTAVDRAALTASVTPQGRFALQNVLPGEYRVLVSDFKHYPFEDRLAQHFHDHPNSIKFTVPGNQPLDIHLKKEWFQKTRKR